MTFKIGLDAGHGKNTAGKRTPDGEREWTFNDKVLRAFVEEMKNYLGYEVKRFDDVTGNKDISLNARTDGSNAWGSDLHISFHHNGNTGKWGTWTGTQVHVYKTRPSGSMKLATNLHPELAKAYGIKDRGIIANDLHITREIHNDAILIEGGFMDSSIDIEALRSDAVLKQAGIVIAKAVAKTYGLVPKPAVLGVSNVKPKSHTIVAGDTFSAIAKKYNMKLQDVIDYNPRVKPTALQIGDVIHLIPVPTSVPKPTVKPVVKPTVKPVSTPKLVMKSVTKRGSKGQAVKDVQYLLAIKGYNLVVDGIFGAGTENAVKDFQRKNKLTADGIVGKGTWSKLA